MFINDKLNLNIKVPNGTRIAVVGDIHEHEEQFDLILNKINPSQEMFFVSVGDIYDKGYGTRVAQSIIDKIRYFSERGCGFMVRGNHELKKVQKALQNKCMTDQLTWVDKQPLALSFIFDNGARVTIVHGGVSPNHTWSDLDFDIETSYIRSLDESGKMIKMKRVNNKYQPEKPGGIPWHKMYDGRFGYIISGHEPLKNGLPSFYNYSSNIDTACYETGIMTCQIVNDKGIDNFFSVKGPCYKRKNM
jgi:predicted phosphodiesterase